MTRKTIVDRLSEQYALPKTMVDAMVCSLIDIIFNNLIEGNDVSIRGFGRFTTRKAKSKKGHDFKNGGVCVISERRIPVLRFSKKRMMELNR